MNDTFPDPCVTCGQPDPGPILDRCDACIERDGDSSAYPPLHGSFNVAALGD